MDNDNSGVTASPAADSATVTAPAQDTQPTGGDAVTSSGDGSQEQTVPFSRFQEVNDKQKAYEERAAKAEQELEAIRQQQSQSSDNSTEDDDDIDPSVKDLVTKIIKKEGYVKKDEVQSAVQASELKRQYSEDVATLTRQYAETAVPFKVDEVRKYAKDNGLNITNKASLDAAYKVMNSDKLLEAAKNAAIAQFKEGGNLSAEKPGSSGAQEPAEPEVRGIKNRIHAASQKLRT